MEEKNRKNLKAALAALPQHEPDPRLWHKIDASLDFEERLQKTIPGMPLHEPADSLWDKIENQLEPVPETRHFHLDRYYRYFAAAAASVILLLVSVYVLKTGTGEKVKIAYSEEVVTAEPSFSAESPDNTEGLQFIREQCSRAPEICAKPEFRELQGQLQQLDEENKKLKQQIEVFGQDPVLIRNQIKIENLRAEFTKELIRIIIS
jgi:hypothetical protein